MFNKKKLKGCSFLNGGSRCPTPEKNFIVEYEYFVVMLLSVGYMFEDLRTLKIMSPSQTVHNFNVYQIAAWRELFISPFPLFPTSEA